jgi:PAP_fibrillin
MTSRFSITTLSRGTGAILATTVVCLALTAQPASAGVTTQQRPPTDRNQVKVKVLKAAVLRVSERAQGTCDQDDNNPVVAAVVNRLTDRLVAAAGSRTEAQKLPQVAGAWKQVWSNLDSSSPVCTRADQIYQVVSPDGFYWNIAENVVPGGASVQGFLRGQYEVTPNFLRIQFTRQAVSPVLVPTGTDLVDLAGQAEAGAFTPLPDSPPVGVRGELQNTYVDDDLRIVRGRDDRPGSPESIFVLVRADATS